ncbi:hypothetical protein EDC14_1002177 [Hydrogenispora ethanolica]|uniref:Uncharacterized protein n=1 Tax=Hydrogenispora ethanolica TaxID=1082276 RepID=A0A4R1SAE5_HYDET|nr:hypothetical protein [Hydrogenispora ethanolica]TCL76418.1 hypothetical protein EDC14_1002177 [Hydrogenispora ethanolica]
MKCFQCGYEFDDAAERCPQCGAEPDKVQVLPPEERENFQGLTIEVEPGDAGGERRQEEGPRRRVFVHRVDVGNSAGGFFLKLLIAGIALLLLIMVLPVALFWIVIVLAGWFGARWWRR